MLLMRLSLPGQIRGTWEQTFQGNLSNAFITYPDTRDTSRSVSMLWALTLKRSLLSIYFRESEVAVAICRYDSCVSTVCSNPLNSSVRVQMYGGMRQVVISGVIYTSIKVLALDISFDFNCY